MGELRLQRQLGEILDTSDVQEAASHVLQAIGARGRWRAASFFVADKEASALRCLATWTAKPEDEEFHAVTRKLLFVAGSGLVGSAFASGKVLAVDRLQDSPFDRQSLAERMGLRSAIVFPLVGRAATVGVCELLGDRPLGNPSFELLNSLGHQIGRYLDRDIRRLAISQKEAELRAIIDTAADGIFWCDSDGRIEWVNKAALKLLGYEHSEVIGGNVVDFLPESYKRRFGNVLTYYFRSTVASFVGRVTEVSGQRKDGSTFPMELSVSRLTFGERDIFTAIMRDISERKLVERRVRQFYSIVSHELRSPLASIRGSLGLIEGGALGVEFPADVKEMLHIARKNCDRLMRLINDMLDAKKLEAGKFVLRKQPLSPQEAVFAAVEGMRSTAAEAQVSVVCRAASEPLVMGDPDRVVQVLTNLLSNAIKFSPSGAQVEIFVEPGINGSNFLRFCVRDHGPGIPGEHLGNLFSEFHQLDGSDSRSRGGTGLGLAISKGIVEELDGQIGVDNTRGSGATFWFELPLAGSSSA